MTMRAQKVLCLTFDNLGQAKQVSDGLVALPDRTAPEVAVAYPRILKLLRQLNVRATFFVEGWSALHFPDVIEAIADDGHEIGLHGWVHEKFSALDERTALQFVNDGTAALRRAGVNPAGFRAPGGVRGPYASDILKSLGYLYDSSVDHEFDPTAPCVEHGEYAGDGVEVLSNGLVNLPWRWSMIDAVQYFLSPYGLKNPQGVTQYWKSVIDNVAQHGGLITLIGHAHVSALDEDRLTTLRSVIEHARVAGLSVLTARQAGGYA